MKVIVGLGNPGIKYQFTRHNIGFMVLDAYAGIHAPAPRFRQEHQSLTLKAKLFDQDVLLVKPQTYMNLSGQGVQRLLHFYHVDISDLLVVHDDIDQDFGALRLQKNRGHGGHNGIRDIHEKLGTNAYFRFKIGVGRPPHEKMAVADFVLQDFSPEQEERLPDLLSECGSALDTYLREGFEKAATRFNRKAPS